MLFRSAKRVKKPWFKSCLKSADLAPCASASLRLVHPLYASYRSKHLVQHVVCIEMCWRNDSSAGESTLNGGREGALRMACLLRRSERTRTRTNTNPNDTEANAAGTRLRCAQVKIVKRKCVGGGEFRTLIPPLKKKLFMNFFK